MSLARHSMTDLAPSVMEPPPIVTTRSVPALRAAMVALITSVLGVCGAILSKVPEYRLPRVRRTDSISSVLLFSVLETIKKTLPAPSLCASSAITSPAGRPNDTESIRLKLILPVTAIMFPQKFETAHVSQCESDTLRLPDFVNSYNFSRRDRNRLPIPSD